MRIENRALLNLKAAGIGMVDQSAGDIAGEHVGKKLNAAKAATSGAAKGGDDLCFGQAGRPFKQNVTISQQGNQQLIDKSSLAQHDLRDFRSHGVEPVEFVCMVDHVDLSCTSTPNPWSYIDLSVARNESFSKPY